MFENFESCKLNYNVYICSHLFVLLQEQPVRVRYIVFKMWSRISFQFTVKKKEYIYIHTYIQICKIFINKNNYACVYEFTMYTLLLLFFFLTNSNVPNEIEKKRKIFENIHRRSMQYSILFLTILPSRIILFKTNITIFDYT